MDTDLIIRRLLGRSEVRRSAYRVLATVSAITLAFGLTGASSVQTSPHHALQTTSPYLRAFPDQDRVDGWNWQPFEDVSLTIANGAGVPQDFGSSTANDQGYVEFFPAYDLMQGDTVTLTGASGEVVHVVHQLYVTSFNTEARMIGGLVDSSGDVHVWTQGADLMVAPSGGSWTADLAPYLDSVQFAQACGIAEAWGLGGNSTIVDWCVPPPPPPPPSPGLLAYIDRDVVEGSDWPANELVSLEIDDPGTGALPDIALSETATEGGSVAFSIAGYDLKRGDVLTMTSGGTVASHTVRQLFVTEIDLEAQTLAGTIDGTETVHVWLSDAIEAYVDSDLNGDWLASFAGYEGHALAPGTCGSAQAWGGGPGTTIVDWCVPEPPPSPWFRVFPETERIEALDWLSGVEVTATVTHPDSTVCSASALSDDSRLAAIQLPEGCGVSGGDVVVVSGDGNTKEHTVTSLGGIWIDPAENWVGGMATPGTSVETWVNEGWTADISTLPNDDGSWAVDFDDIGTDLLPGMTGRARQVDADGDRTVVDWSVPPSPWLIAFPENDAVEPWEWPDGATVNLSIDDPATEASPDYSTSAVVSVTPWGDPRTYARIEFAGIYDLKPGDRVTITDGATSRMHEVRNLSVTEVDEAADTVTGTADSDAVVDVWPHGGDAATVQSVVVVNGAWTASFSGLYDLAPGVGGRSRILDDYGNYTAVDWNVPTPPSPWLTAFPEWDFVEGFEWPLGASVHLIIEDPATEISPDVELDDAAEPSPWGDPRTYVSYDLAGAIDLKPGDEITLTDGITVRTMVVQNLAITGVDVGEDTVAGTAEPGAIVNVWPHATGVQIAVTAGEGGHWQVDFGLAYDIEPGSSGRAEIRDEFYNGTAVDWYVPNPWFTAFPEGEVIEGWDWPLDAMVHMTIDDPAVPGDTNFMKDGQVTLAPWGDGQHWLWIEFPGEYDLKAGDFVTLTDGVTERTHTVQELAFNSANPDENTASGTAAPGAEVILWSWEDPEGRRLTTAADDFGSWSADFDDVGFDLEPGFHVRAEVWEGVNDTAVDREVRSPRIAVYLEADVVIGWDWTRGADLHLSVDDPSNGEGVDFEADTVVGPAPWDPNTWWADFEFGGAYDVKPGDRVTVTDGTTVREHVVLPLTVDDVSGAADTVAGTSLAGAMVYVHPWDAWFEAVQSDEFGNWSMDFAGLYELSPGIWGIAEVFDEGDNSTAIDWMVPLDIDIQPWSSANLVACEASWTLVPVAVFSESGFDATGIDHDSVRFGRTGAEAAVVQILGRPLRYSRDLNGDGLLDMVYTFRFGDTGFSCADVPLGQRYATVEGILTGGMGDISLEGRDNLTLFRLLRWWPR